MDRELNSRLEKDIIYEIYRGCRLCGAGAGYKMPIVQNVVDLEENGVKLSQKIRECVQIEVHQDDKMPPLICELCVDKVNDFYEFLEMCRLTNKQTRLKLGLPSQTSSTDSDFGSSNCCILGMSESICIDDDSDVEPLSKHTSKSRAKERHKEETHRREQRSRSMKEIKVNNKDTPSPARVTRTSCSNIRQDKMPLIQLIKEEHVPVRVTRTSSGLHQQQTKNHAPIQATLNNSKTVTKPKSILKKQSDNESIKIEDETSFFLSRKRAMGNNEERLTPSSKRVRISSGSPKPRSRSSARSSSQNANRSRSKRSRSPVPEAAPPPQPASDIICPICYQSNRTSKGYHNHMRIHVANYTNIKLACNPCGEWFLNSNESQEHHRRHKFNGLPYTCRRCSAEFKEIKPYDVHLTNGECIPYDEVPDVKCEVCWRYFATDNLLIEHKCPGEDGRPGGKCNKCNRTYVLMKNLKRHETVCMHKNKSKLVVAPGVMESLKTVEVCLERCDSMLSDRNRKYLNASCTTQNYGLVENCVYPYISSVRSLKIKSEPIDDGFDCMVDINDKVKEFLTEEDCIDWDSEIEDNGAGTSVGAVNRRQRVDTLAALALKAVVSQRFLGKVPKKYRKIKVEKMFDSLGEFGVKNVDRLLERLEDDVDTSDGKNKTGEVTLEDSAVDKTVNVSDGSNSASASVGEERRNSGEISVSERNSNISESVERCSNSANETSIKINLNNEEGCENISISNSKEETDEERVNSIILEGSDSELQGSTGRNDGKEYSNSLEEAIRNESEKDLVTEKDIAVELNGHESENIEDTSVSTVSHEVLEHKNGITNKSLTLNHTLVNTDMEDQNLMDALENELGGKTDIDDNTNKNSPGDWDSSKEMLDHNKELGANVCNEKSDQSANGDSGRVNKILFDDILANKDVHRDSPYLDAISDDDYNFDI